MHVGIAMFCTDYSIGPAALAMALEERGFESLWCPEHSHIPLTRTSPYPSGGELLRRVNISRGCHGDEHSIIEFVADRSGRKRIRHRGQIGDRK